MHVSVPEACTEASPRVAVFVTYLTVLLPLERLHQLCRGYSRRQLRRYT